MTSSAPLDFANSVRLFVCVWNKFYTFKVFAAHLWLMDWELPKTTSWVFSFLCDFIHVSLSAQFSSSLSCSCFSFQLSRPVVKSSSPWRAFFFFSLFSLDLKYTSMRKFSHFGVIVCSVSSLFCKPPWGCGHHAFPSVFLALNTTFDSLWMNKYF